MRFVHNLLPQLQACPSARILSIHGAGREGHLNENDLLLKDTFSFRNAAMHTSTMNSLALGKIASSYPTISCVHTFPGVVITPAYETFSEDWPLPLHLLFQWGVVPLLKLVTTSVPESGERQLFCATSARYPPAATRQGPGAGVKLPEGVQVAKGSDWKEGSGCYIVHWDGETVGDKKLFDEYRQRDMATKIWEHTCEVFAQATHKSAVHET